MTSHYSSNKVYILWIKLKGSSLQCSLNYIWVVWKFPHKSLKKGGKKKKKSWSQIFNIVWRTHIISLALTTGPFCFLHSIQLLCHSVPPIFPSLCGTDFLCLNLFWESPNSYLSLITKLKDSFPRKKQLISSAGIGTLVTYSHNTLHSPFLPSL